ncbi:hypothetical protein [Acidithiobacillus sp. AMEEHan]|uniref:hypothetical protein n=1 Tax=Acidithiobacillus sp. AMEEHan TaxID=2994951 RepID=UPI0027E506A4|nr:hypothetical protein [Acidithiobacillus sp. AMEEHan]
MLHAIENKKSRLPFERYVSAAERTGERRTQEDEITSTIFGPLDFFSEETVRSIIGEIFGFFFKSSDSKLSLSFWPRYNNVEPDLVFTEEHSDGSGDAYVIEIKWNAPLGDEQVERQIQAIEAEDHLRLAGHIVLSRYAIDVAKPSRNLTWMDFKDRCLELSEKNAIDPIAKKWAKLVGAFLEACDVCHFNGFDTIMSFAMDGIRDREYLFWLGRQFDWNTIELPSESFLSRCERGTIFYRSAAAL